LERAKEECLDIPAYCFMPDHLHLLISGVRETSDCLAFINGFKQRSGYTFKHSTGKKLWQHKPHDHILRPNDRDPSVGI
jgi:putative transposase